MGSRSRVRLVVLHVMVMSLLLSLGGRLWYLQVMNGQYYRRVAADNGIRDIIVPAPRGQILDDAGRPLVRNRTALVVSADRTVLLRQKDGGKAVLQRLAGVLKVPYAQLADKIRLCGPGVTRPCWTGSPYQPIPLDDNADARKALQIRERQEDFPGISAQLQAVRDYPRTDGAGAAQALGYLQPITQEELNKRKGIKVTGYSGADLIGRDGLEAVYDGDLRGAPGIRRVLVDSQGRVTGVASENPPVSGGNLVTSLDAKVQGDVESALKHAIDAARKRGDPADSGAAVVMDVRTGRVIALGSYPTYNPAVWTGGISQSEYDALLNKNKGQPLISRVTQGEFAPGSTFKISSLPAAVRDGYSLHGTYGCPSSYMVGARAFSNFEGESGGDISLHQAIVMSCDTVFYRFAYEEWLRDGGMHPVKNPKDPMIKMAKDFGFGKRTGIDLVGESAGRIPSRQWKKDYWEATKASDCKHGKTGYPDVAKTDPSRAAYLKQMAAENCVDGYVFRAGDAANFSVGQGDVLVTPLQLARAYAAVANGGTLWSPRVGKAVLAPNGTVARRIDPVKAGKLPISQKVLAYMRSAFADVPKSGTAAGPFGGFPFDKLPVAGKTGTAEVWGKKDNSWFASYAPANNPHYVVVVMVTQTGTGSTTAAPAVREIWEDMYGLRKGKKADLPDGKVPDRLPTLAADGTIAPPPGFGEPEEKTPAARPVHRKKKHK
ncbi:penicillin-binding protein 2 [Actinoallomurus sp. NBC_01490]|uniref:penicillin-binding protein 2 n=1 Tax=Actinoallomurus sp. NBC_01490 TaxID=2903557 RepID=UPI002E3023AF|nr:penicillin-binding protein 2 [Actinoallomurus sp. NBC_01490]